MASKRNYLDQEELAEFADITVIDPTEADDQISMAEEIIDDYVGFQEKFFPDKLQGAASAVSGNNSFTLQTEHISGYQYTNYFKDLFVEIIGGDANTGQRRKITASTSLGVITTDAFSATLSENTVYKIYQLGKFPRRSDVFVNTKTSPYGYFKSIPEAVKRAVAAQLEYKINMGDGFFSSADDITRERIGDYEVERANAKGGTQKLIAPKARLLLKEIINRIGELVV